MFKIVLVNNVNLSISTPTNFNKCEENNMLLTIFKLFEYYK